MGTLWGGIPALGTKVFWVRLLQTSAEHRTDWGIKKMLQIGPIGFFVNLIAEDVRRWLLSICNVFLKF